MLARPKTYSERDTVNKLGASLAAQAIDGLDSRAALEVAQAIIAAILEDGVSYADFVAAQDAKRRIKRAHSELGGVS